MKNLKTLYLLGLLLIMALGNSVKAQQEPMFTQYTFNPISVNPAYAGTRNALNINSLTRLQWVGLEGAPKTYSIAAHTPYNKKKVGLGVTLITDEVGPIRNTYFTVNYAYRVNLTEKIKLSMGLKGGIVSYKASIRNLELNDPNDPVFAGNDKRVNPNLGAGVYLYADNYYFGFSAPKLFQTTLDEENQQGNEMRRHYYIIGGYALEINPSLVFKPTVLFKAVEGSPLSTDLTAQFLLQNKFWIGTMYRIGDALGLFANVKITEQLTVGYGYDYSLNGLSGFNNGTHEIVISYDFYKFHGSKVKSPRYF
jgi:type IX secretion system PorP/SprF family membrane protein